MKIKKNNITQQIVAYINENIENGTWKEGDQIESELCMSEKLGVSRASVRVAIRQFIAYGKLESIQGKGTYVRSSPISLGQTNFTSNDCDDIHKVMQFRCAIEKEAAFLAAQNATKEEIAELQKAIEDMNEADQLNDQKRSWGCDMAFHQKIAQMAHNQFFEAALNMVFQTTYNLHFKIIQTLGVRFGSYYHPLILEAIATHRGKDAQRYMVEHLWDFANTIEVDKKE